MPVWRFSQTANANATFSLSEARGRLYSLAPFQLQRIAAFLGDYIYILDEKDQSIKRGPVYDGIISINEKTYKLICIDQVFHNHIILIFPLLVNASLI